MNVGIICSCMPPCSVIFRQPGPEYLRLLSFEPLKSLVLKTTARPVSNKSPNQSLEHPDCEKVERDVCLSKESRCGGWTRLLASVAISLGSLLTQSLFFSFHFFTSLFHVYVQTSGSGQTSCPGVSTYMVQLGLAPLLCSFLRRLAATFGFCHDPPANYKVFVNRLFIIRIRINLVNIELT